LGQRRRHKLFAACPAKSSALGNFNAAFVSRWYNKVIARQAQGESLVTEVERIRSSTDHWPSEI